MNQPATTPTTALKLRDTGYGLLVRMATGDYLVQAAPDATDEFAGEWMEVFYAGELVERLQLRSEVKRP